MLGTIPRSPHQSETGRCGCVLDAFADISPLRCKFTDLPLLGTAGRPGEERERGTGGALRAVLAVDDGVPVFGHWFLQAAYDSKRTASARKKSFTWSRPWRWRGPPRFLPMIHSAYPSTFFLPPPWSLGIVIS